MILDIVYVLLVLILLSIALKFKSQESNIFSFIFLSFAFIFFILFIYNIVVKTTILAIALIVYILIIKHLGKEKYYNLKLKELVFHSDKISEEINLVYVADFQHDYREDIYNERMAKKVTDLINEQEYDILLLGGDYINYSSHYEDFNNTLKQIENTKNAYAVWGNHDLPFKEELFHMFEAKNIKILNNEHQEVTIGSNKINVSGVDDLWTGLPDYNEIKIKMKEELLHIHLLHNPDFFDKIKHEDIDLALAGHYHAGQVVMIPRLPMQRIVSKYIYGLFTTPTSKMFVTSGAGGSFGRGKFGGFLRFNSEPEIVKIKFKPSR